MPQTRSFIKAGGNGGGAAAGGAQLSIVTYRENDPMGAKARAFYEMLDFASAEDLTVSDYPCQRLTVIVPDAPLTADRKQN